MASASSIASIMCWMPVLFFWPAKKAITYPRMGYVNFSPERKTQEKKKLSALIIVLFLPIILGIAIFLIVSGKTGLAPESVDWLRGDTRLIFGVILAGLISAGALLSGVRHLHIYAALTLIAVIGGHLLKIPRHLYFISPGVVISLCGIVALVRFLHKYRLPVEEVSNGKD